MQIGIVGLPNVGKSSLFNALTAGHAACSNYPFTTIDPNVGVVQVPDPRLKRLTQIFNSQQNVPSTIRFVDIAGLVAGASQGQGLGNQFLGHIREVDAIIHVVRLFEDKDVVHSLGAVDPLRDVQVIETELALADLESIERQIEKNEGRVKAGDKTAKERAPALARLKEALAAGRPASTLDLDIETLTPFFLLTAKPVLFVGNVGDSGAHEPWQKQMREFAGTRRAAYLEISVKLESEIAQISQENERRAFLDSMGLNASGLERIIMTAKELLGLITFFTAGPKETRGWNIPQGLRAPEAAGKIHTDMQKGFVRAEIYAFTEMDRLGSEAALRSQGLLRSEGKDYIVKDGDVIFFKFTK